MTQAARSEQARPAAPRAPRPTLHLGGKAPIAAPFPSAEPPIVPSAPQLFPLIELLRAPENVRHVRADEDVEPLAVDIAQHGLLQSLIGYQGARKVMIVGGGRRYQALMKLWEAGRIDGAFLVPVLIRDVEEAVELSLAENLQQRTMSPVDEFLAFKALMDRGDTSPAKLAARFGFSETVVKQRLRLADLAPEVLDALASRRITIDAATAYASTQDRALQVEVFKVQDRKGGEPHRPANIRSDVGLKGMRTTDAIFTFVGAEAYEAEGGGYEDDLFAESAVTAREGRVLDKPFLARGLAERLVADRAPELLDRLRADPKLAPTIDGFVVPDSLRIWNHGIAHDAKLKPPTGFVEVDRRYGDEAKVWKTIRNNGIEAHVIVAIGDKGELVAYTRRLFVPKAQKNAVDQQTVVKPAPEPTAEERAERERQLDIAHWARRLAVGPWAGTPLEGRAFWLSLRSHEDRHDRVTQAGVKGYLVPVRIFVSDEQIDAATPTAAARVDEERAIAAELQRRRKEIEALDAEPAVIEVDGAPAYRWSDASYRDGPQPPAGEDENGPELRAWRLYGLLKDARTIGEGWTSIEAYRADRADDSEGAA